VRKRIGECLVHAGVISESDLGIALAEHARTGGRVGAVLLRLGLTTEWQLARTLAHQLGLPYRNFSHEPPDPDAIVLIPKDVAFKRLSIGTRIAGDRLTVAMADPLLFGLIKDLEVRTGRWIVPAVATRTDILRAIQVGYGTRRSGPRSGDRPSGLCVKCRRGLEAGWQFCPYCAARVAPRLAAPGALPDAASM
jgi:type IV pilus assembly protein PilB